jgi:hypothetical protein
VAGSAKVAEDKAEKQCKTLASAESASIIAATQRCA